MDNFDLFRKIAILLFSITSPILIGQTVNFEEVLEASLNSIENEKRFEYQIYYEEEGRSLIANVIQHKADVKDIGFGNSKVIVEGFQYLENAKTPFRFSYDGTYFKYNLDGSESIKTLKNPTVKQTGQILGLNFYMVASRYLAKKNGLQSAFKNLKKVEYTGTVRVENTEAYRFNMLYEFSNPATGQKTNYSNIWFFDTKTYLPVKTTSTGSIRQVKMLRSKNDDSIVFDINSLNEFKETIMESTLPNAEGLPLPGSIFPSFSLENLNGKVNTNSLFKDSKITLVDFWGTWCGPCLIAMPDLEYLYQKYRMRGFNVVGISVYDNIETTRNYLQKNKYNYSFLLEGEEFAEGVGIDIYPTIFLVDSNGKILFAEKGKREESISDYERIIESHLKDNE